jgi:hypothetical protein
MKCIFGFFLALSIIAQSSIALAQNSVVENVVKACQIEIEDYCSQVTPGEGRLLACFYAHENKLTVQCINALYDGMATLERAVEAISYVAGQCREDIQSKCGATVPGEGRIAECLLNKKAELSSRCSGAIDEVGLKKN